MKKVDVAVIDSGVGGLSLLKTFVKNLPFKKYLYFADTKNLPYGNKSPKELFDITCKNIDYILKNYNPHLIVFGCNTIGTTIISKIKNAYKTKKIFAINPCLKNAIGFKNNNGIKNKILLLATKGTINKIQDKPLFLKNREDIILCKMPKLASKVENNLENLANIVPYLQNKLKKLKSKTDIIILGCTHYYFVKSIIKEVLPNKIILDGRNILLEKIKKSIQNSHKCCSNKTPKIIWHFSNNKNFNIKKYKKVFRALLSNNSKNID